MKRPNKAKASNDPAHRRAVEAAVRHAEKVVRSSGKTEPVIYRPPAATAPKTRNATPAPKEHAPSNPAMEQALREALGLPARIESIPTRSSNIAKSRNGATDRPQRVATQTPPAPKEASSTRPAPPSLTPAKPKARRKKTGATPQPVVPKKAKAPKKGKAPKKAKPTIVVVRKLAASDVDRRKGAATNAASRLAINARMRSAAAEAGSKPILPFVELQRRWQQAFAYLQRFEESDPDAPDVLAAKQRLADVEAEWSRRQTLAPDHPEYFPWPSTEASGGDGSVSTGEWQEIGMLAYLGYHVGLSSTLTAAQRAQLLGRIFVMHLPPLNGITYMRQWGTPQTASRLRKIAEGLAAFARNAKRRRNPSLAEAICHWEDDLSYLRRTYYVGRFDFPWPMP